MEPDTPNNTGPPSDLPNPDDADGMSQSNTESDADAVRGDDQVDISNGTVLGGASLGSTSLGGNDSSNTKNKKRRRNKKNRSSEEERGPKSVVIPTQKYIEDMSNEEEEESEYRRGGYHPVKIGNVFNNRYKILHKLGWGHFSTVWESTDTLTERVVAIKIVKSARHYAEAARDEIKILQAATRNDSDNDKCVIHLLDDFEISGPNGRHVAMVFEKLGCNLLTLIRLYKYKGLPIPLVKAFSKQTLVGLHFLHTNLIIHTDLKPENLLVHTTPVLPHRVVNGEKENYSPKSNEELIEVFGGGAYKVKIVDLGNACWTYEHFTDDVQTRQYRAPEVILGAKYDTAIDIWSMGCIIFELITGDLLFEPKSSRNFEKNDDHLAQIIELLGKMPRHIALNGRNSHRFFNRRGELLRIKNLKFWPMSSVLHEKYKLPEDEANEISSFLNPMLQLDPRRRTTAAETLLHDWIADVDINDFLSCFSGG
eukprot:TRINITY_DN2692_c0_g1_i1.p1 TRINITY_DN2692_c0_g1~~TRINITY_DN2692_c0_g1_i1.p1  ORF type:complete len:481 (-),score=120.28 TRINITY_DN2692_c0_g1_i1:1158-2600(-)